MDACSAYRCMLFRTSSSKHCVALYQTCFRPVAVVVLVLATIVQLVMPLVVAAAPHRIMHARLFR